MALESVTGTITHKDGTTSEFLISTTSGDWGWSQWGAPDTYLGDTIPLLDGLVEAIDSLGVE